MDKATNPSSYIPNIERAHAIAYAEAPFRDALYIHETILNYFNAVLEDIKAIAEEYNELEQLVAPVSYDYLINIFDGDDFVETDLLHKIITIIFANYMDEYGYDGATIVYSLPLAYLLVRLGQYNTQLERQMAVEGAVAERRYIASMN